MILVLAGNYKQYCNWMERNNHTPETAKYVSLPEQVRGFQNCKYVISGEYKKNEAYTDEVLTYLKLHNCKQPKEAQCSNSFTE